MPDTVQDWRAAARQLKRVADEGGPLADLVHMSTRRKRFRQIDEVRGRIGTLVTNLRPELAHGDRMRGKPDDTETLQGVVAHLHDALYFLWSGTSHAALYMNKQGLNGNYVYHAGRTQRELDTVALWVDKAIALLERE